MDRNRFLKWATSMKSGQPEAPPKQSGAPRLSPNNPFRTLNEKRSGEYTAQYASQTPPASQGRNEPLYQEQYSQPSHEGHPEQAMSPFDNATYEAPSSNPFLQHSGQPTGRPQQRNQTFQVPPTVQLSGGGVRMGYATGNAQPVPLPAFYQQPASSQQPAPFPAAETGHPWNGANANYFEDNPPAYEPYRKEPVENRSGPTQYRSEQAHYRPGQTEYRPEQAPYGAEQTQYHPWQGQYRPEQTQYRPEQAQYRPEQAKYHSGPAQYHSGPAQYHSEQMRYRAMPGGYPSEAAPAGYGPPPGEQPMYHSPPTGNHSTREEQAARPRLQLDGIPELNILVLGETGVGKSTFINAFVNYIYFQSLDDALKRQELQCVIPSSFTWQSLDGDDYIAKVIHVVPNTGNHNDEQALRDERDGTQGGQSATQWTKTYEMSIGGTVVRLIDTPGIGDTRGASQDKKNMDDILAKLRTVDVLHGILILLKPNNARLGVMFSFCLKELLTHLHRDAAKNIVFGFTNARNTSFRPGETYATLKAMLDQDKKVGIQLGRNTTYFFDSESFRCLAAHHNGLDIHDMGDIGDYRLSWNKSADETYRMLEHFRPTTTAPHHVAETWDLYRTREMVRVLTVPMADITQTINDNIGLQKDEQRDLTDALAKGQTLDTALYLSKKVYHVEPLSMPRTVCSDRACVEYKDNEKHYKTLCHDPCYLENVDVDIFPCEALMSCYTFSQGTDRCLECGHSWQVHLHINYERVENIVQVEDEAVSLRITENKSAVEVMEQALRSRQELIKKYEMERDIIQKAAGQFAVFLKRSSIKPWNDSKLAYLDHLIDEEQGKVEAGGPDKRLKDLKADRAQHAEEIRTLTEFAQSGENDQLLDQEGIKGLINGLYSLELTGPNLKKCAQQLEDIQNSTYDKNRAQAAAPKKSHSHRGQPARGGKSGHSTAGRKQAQEQGSGVSGFFKNLRLT